MDKITADDVEALLDSPAVDPLMVRRPDGSVDIRSAIPTGDPDEDDYRIIIRQADLPMIDQSGMDFDNLTPADLAALAQSLTLSDADEEGD